MYETGKVRDVHEVEIQSLPDEAFEESYLMLVRVGSDKYNPNQKDLEDWKKTFERMKHDKRAVIVCSEKANVEVEMIKISDLVFIE